MGQRTQKLAADNPMLLENWDWVKNNEQEMYPDEISCGSTKKAWWLCPKKHSYSASISHKLNGRGCPYCANRKVLIGYNDLKTTHPSLAKEWDYTKNYPLNPTDVVGGSHKKVWWKCPLGHEYEMTVLDRTQGSNCPVCCGKRVLKGVNDLATTHPHLIKEWNWDRNNYLKIYPEKLTYGSTKKVWWKCPACGYEWSSSPNNRTSSRTSCPCCASRVIVPGINDLQTLYPEVAKKWHPTKNKKNPCNIAPFCNDKAWFVCDKDSRHVFYTRICSLTNGDTVCPICSNQKIIVGINDFQSTNPELMQEWNWKKNSAACIDPTKITKGVDKKVWWICNKCGNEWQASVGSRAGSQRCGCPECKKDLSSSFPEKAIAYYLSKKFNIEENKKFDWLGNSELDIYINDLKIGIEYDGQVWHTNIKNDLKKDNLCKQHGISLVRIRENSCPTYKSNAYKIYRKGMKNDDLDDCINSLLLYISQNYNVQFLDKANVNKDYIEILTKISTSKREKSVASSSLIDTWNYKKNGKLLPENISLNSNKKVWWICKKGHEWQASIYSRSGKQKCGCPYCAGQKVLTGENDLETLYPNIVKEWDFSKNLISPKLVKPMSNKKYWWICSKCGNEYSTTPAHRIGRGQGCSNCGRLITISSHYKKVMNIELNQTYDSIKEAGLKTGIKPTNISNCCRGVTKTAGGYHWKFII